MQIAHLTIPKWVYISIALLAFGMLYAIAEWEWMFLVSPFLFLVGLILIVFGIQAVVTRRAEFTDPEGADYQQQRTQIGLSALAHGLMFILLGLLALAGAFIRLLGVWEPVWGYFTAHPGWLWGLGGVGVLLVSLQGLLGYQEENKPGWLMLSSLPKRLLSLVGIVLGIGMIGIGLAGVFLPAWFDGFMAQLRSWLPSGPEIYDQVVE